MCVSTLSPELLYGNADTPRLHTVNPKEGRISPELTPTMSELGKRTIMTRKRSGGLVHIVCLMAQSTELIHSSVDTMWSQHEFALPATCCVPFRFFALREISDKQWLGCGLYNCFRYSRVPKSWRDVVTLSHPLVLLGSDDAILLFAYRRLAHCFSAIRILMNWRRNSLKRHLV